MGGLRIFLAAFCFLFVALPVVAQTRLDMLASILPTHRSAVKDGTVSFFATVLNASTTDTLTNCKPVFTADQSAQDISRKASFTFQTVDGANALTGTPNTAIDIPPSTFQGFVFGMDGKIQNAGNFFTSDLSVRFQCDNGIPQENVYLNTASIFVSDAKPPVDALSIAQTPSADGIVRINAAGGAEAFAVAATNLGAGGAENVVVTPTLDVPVDIDDAARATKFSSPFGNVASLSICETNSVTGACLAGPTPSVVASLGAGVSTFSVFVTANATTGIGLVPQWLRVTVNFVPQNAAPNEIAGRTSVALQAPGVPLGAPQNFAELPAGLYAVRMRPNGDATASSIMDGEMLVIDRSAVAAEKPESGAAPGKASRPEAESDETNFEALGHLMEQLITDVDGSIMEVGPNATGLDDFTFRINEPIRHQDDGKQVADANHVLPSRTTLRSRLYSGQNFSTIRDFNNRANRGNETVLTHQIKTGSELKEFTTALGTSISANGEIFAVLKDPVNGDNIGDFNLSQLVGTQSNSLSFSATENCTMTIDEAPADFTNNFALFVVTLTTNQILGGRCPQVGRYNLFLYASVFSRNIFGNPTALDKFYFTALFVGRPFSATAGKGQVIVGEFDPAAQ
jgi:hypothetical protein